MKKILVITGQTATGKTSFGIDLAKEFNGEIISADSRQVYKFMDIGTGKDVANFQFLISNFKSISNSSIFNDKFTYGYYDVNGIRIWGLDIVEPDYRFNVADWIDYTEIMIEDMRSRGKLPIIVGGSGQYLRSLLNPPETIRIRVNQKLRNSLLHCSIVTLQEMLQKADSDKWKSMNESDRKNPRRLIRAIEVAGNKSKIQDLRPKPNDNFRIDNTLIIGLTAPREIINQRIDQRVDERMEHGMIEEVKSLTEKGFRWDLPSMSGIGYREFRDYSLQSYLPNILDRWKVAEHQYAKRQLTYLKKYLPDAFWFDIASKNYQAEIRKKIQSFVY